MVAGGTVSPTGLRDEGEARVDLLTSPSPPSACTRVRTFILSSVVESSLGVGTQDLIAAVDGFALPRCRL